jgi:hypothetical protein
MRWFIQSLLSLVLFFGFGLPGSAQHNEVYFSFQVKEPSVINELTHLISIDHVEGNTVKAYANTSQYMKFMKLGYAITQLPPPGESPGIEMVDHSVLNPSTTWNFYPTYPNYESLMAQFQSMYPGICHLDTLTTLQSGRRLLVLKISDNVSTDEAEPEFFYSSSIHGDETTGYIMMLHLADYLLSNYGTNSEATDLVNNLEIFICPLANPDGTYYGGNNSVYGARRYNSAGVDLNRNYPDPQNGPHPDGYAWQPETVAFMDFATQRHFVAACNFHGGTEVVNYPWDTWAILHADDDWYQYTSREYADTVHLHAPAGYMDDLDNGVTNGYAWYEINGGRQDYMNYFHHCRETTIEISTTKLLPSNQLVAHWNYNWRSFILQMKEAGFGVHGIITDQATGNPVSAKVFITGHDNNGSEVYSSVTLGDYHRPLKAGTYSLEISAPGYQPQTITGVTVSDHASLTLNIQLLPLVLDLQNQSIVDVQCFNATQSITVAGNGTSFTVEAGGSATMIAGLNIVYFPGTTIVSGGYMSGYITTSSQYCTTQVPSMVAVLTGEGEPPAVMVKPGLKIYPNPTNSIFSLVLTDYDESEMISISIFNMRGQKIISKEVKGGMNDDFSLSGNPPGIYFLQVFSTQNAASAPIVKL